MAADHMISIGINDDWSFERASAALNPALRLVGVDATTTAWYVVGRGQRLRVEYLLACLAGRRTRREFLKTRMSSVFEFWRYWAKHDLPAHREQVTRFFAALRPHLVLVHLHAKTYDGVDRDTALPKAIEATWLAPSLMPQPAHDVKVLPRPGLDHPSKYSHE